STRYAAIRLWEKDAETYTNLSANPAFRRWREGRDRLLKETEQITGEDFETAVANDKYGFISGALKEVYTPTLNDEIRTTSIIDSFVTHKLFGFPVFILVMWLMFEATFTLGAYPMEWIEAGVGALGAWIGATMNDGMLKDLIADGILGGVGGVIVFLPNILILYLFISFMEDSGYMARAAFIMDKLMHRMGLHGKSFIPLVMGFGCNVPAIMATRTIESHSSRIITILVNPFISCSARLPVYVLIIGTFFPHHGSTVMLSLYLTGIVVAVVVARLFRKFIFKKDETPFVMELPPYRIPTARSTLRHMWDKAAQYLRKMGGIILVASIVVWLLSYFPRVGDVPEGATAAVPANYGAVENGVQATDDTFDLSGSFTGAVENSVPAVSAPVPENSYGLPGTSAAEEETSQAYLQQKNSYIGRLGQAIEPVMRPLGFDWRLGVSLISGAAAKEIVVSTLGVLYAGDGEDYETLSERLTSPNPETGRPDMTPLTAISFLVFVLLYSPCIAALVAIARETGSWKWAAFSFLFNTVVAWIVAFIVYNIGSLFVG
ncbi:MAG: ferrous iron transport protein B, partial [Rikenellaceae bacterium]|nr:ferrous iron transport protein B [Rikenellaceae bacterium]